MNTGKTHFPKPVVELAQIENFGQPIRKQVFVIGNNVFLFLFF